MVSPRNAAQIVSSRCRSAVARASDVGSLTSPVLGAENGPHQMAFGSRSLLLGCFESVIPSSGLTLLSGLRLFCRQLSTDCFHPFTGLCSPLPAIRRRVDQLFKASGKFGSVRGSDFAEQRLDFREHANMLSVAVVEELQADGSIVDECCRHVPVGYNHPQMTAVVTEDGLVKV